MATNLRQWQEDALRQWTDKRHGVASVVTGAGKTRFAIECAAEQRRRDSDVRVLVIVPTLALLDQWVSVLQGDIRVRDERIAVHRDGEIAAGSAVYNVATVNTARIATRALTANGRWMVVADECHRYGSPANRSAIDAEWIASLGLSATPSREYDTWFEEYVEPAIGRVFFEYGYHQALEDGVLVPVRLSNLRVPLTRSEQTRYDQLTRRIAILSASRNGGDLEGLKRTSLARARLAQSAKARVPAACAIMEQHRGERVLIFHERVTAAQDIAARLSASGHRTVLYHSAMTMANRILSLMMFRTGQADVLVSCRALDEGIDVPDATFGLICASSASTRQRIQRLGRLLRPSEGKTSAEIATLYATETEEERLRNEEAELEGVSSVSWHEVRFR